MKKAINVFGALVVAGITIGTAHAEEVWYVDEPAFMGHKDNFSCEIQPGYAFNRCLLGDPNYERVLLSNGDRKYTQNQQTRLAINCADGICETNAGEYIGLSDHSFYAVIPLYYYIWGTTPTEEGKLNVQLYKQGTGPGVSDFPGWYVENGTVPSTPTVLTKAEEEDKLFREDFDAWLAYMAEEYGAWTDGCSSMTVCEVHFGTRSNIVESVTITNYEMDIIASYLF